jgi:ubiquinone/menaquinone biosynthesis C-methylase UbiE
MSDNNVKQKVTSTFDEVATRYDKIPFFKHSAANIAELVTLKNDATLLDVACGTGNVILHMAALSNNYTCDAIDISEGMLNVAKANAKARNIDTINFHIQDIESIAMDKKYDLITCSYVLFFLPNPIDTLKKLYSHLAIDGQLLFCSFTDQAFEPSSSLLLDLLESYGVERMDKSSEENKWKMLKSEEAISHLCNKANIENFEISQQVIRYPMSIQEWWALNNDAGYRGMLMQLNIEDYEALKNEYEIAMSKLLDDKKQLELIADSYYCLIRK